MQAIFKKKLQCFCLLSWDVLPIMRLSHSLCPESWKICYMLFQHVVNQFPNIQNARRCDVVFTLPRNPQSLTPIRVLLRYARKDNPALIIY